MTSLFAVRNRAWARTIRALGALLLAALGFGAACAANAQVMVDFDTGTPALSVYHNLPIDQTSGGVTAHLTGLFSIQTGGTTGWTLSQFSGHFLMANSSPAVLDITLSQYVTNFSFTFATADFPPIETPSLIQLTAFTNSAATPAIGSTTAHGAYGTDTMPMGTLSFSATQPFNVVRIQMAPSQPTGNFLVDNISVQTAGGTLCAITVSASPSGGGSVVGGAVYSGGVPVTAVATPNAGFAFLNWTEGGVPVSTSASYTFTASADRALVANFIATFRITTSAVPSLGGTTSGDGTYNSTSNVTVVAAANAGFAFLNWTENSAQVSTSASYSFTAVASRTLVANFTNFTPALSIQLTATNTVAISWPSPSTGYILKENYALGTTNWANSTNPITDAGGQRQAILSPSSGGCLYRLSTP